MSESTAVATTPAEDEVESARRRGRALVAHKKEVNELFKTIAGMEWGAGTQVVKGSSFSEETRYAMAKFCQVTGANPMTQVDILGGKPYLNANYWSERIITDPLFVDMIVRSITEETEEQLRAKARDNREAYDGLRGSDPSAAAQHLSRALRLEEDADYLAEARAHWGAPKWASCVYEVEVRRFMNAAPMDAIRDGRVPMEEAEKWIISVKEANWAGNRPREKKKNRSTGAEYTYDPDPVGNAEPEKTARTRAMRRCAIRAFPAWREEYESQIERAEKMIEAEFEIIQEDTRRQVAVAAGPQAVSTAAGEPEAAPAAGARPLPVDGEDEEGPDVEIVQDEPEPEAEPADTFDRADARKRFFATLRESGIKGDARKAWAKENKFPESTSDWGKEDYDRAQEILVGPVRDRVLAMVKEQGEDLEDLSLRVINQRSPDYLVHWKALDSSLQATAASADDEDGDEDLDQL